MRNKFRFLEAMIKKYKLASLRKQIQILMVIFLFIPVLLSMGALFAYFSEILTEKTVSFAHESMEDKAESLSGYMNAYMDAFYQTVIDEELWEKMEVVPYQETVNNSRKVFSILENNFTSTINDVVLSFCMREDESGFLHVRRPSGRKNIITENSNVGYEGLINLAKASIGDDLLVTRPYFYNDKICIAMSHRIYNYKTKENYGNLVMVMYQDKIWSILEESKTNYISYVLQTGEGSLLTKGGELEIGQVQVMESSERIPKTDWKLLYNIDYRQIEEDVGKSMVFFFSVIVILFFVTIQLMNYFVRRRMQSLDMLEDSMAQVRKYEKYELLPQQEVGELNSLFNGYNKMVREIMNQKQRILRQNEEQVKSLKRQQEAEIKALELEINSHFIYNTLNAINYTAVIHDDYETSDQLKIFANVLRYMTERRYQMVTLEQELEWLKQYLFLQRSRFNDAFEYEIIVQPEIRNWKIRKLVLQPFVENAVIHGVSDLSYPGRIIISCKKDGEEKLEICIEDNGKGIETDRLHIIRQRMEEVESITDDNEDALGLGMSNTCYRMKLYYGEAFRFSISDNQTGGTTVTLHIPII